VVIEAQFFAEADWLHGEHADAVLVVLDDGARLAIWSATVAQTT